MKWAAARLAASNSTPLREIKTESNELCVDSANGTLLSEKLGNDFIENGDFFPFAGALFPGTISYSDAGVLKMQVTQTMTALTDATPNVLAAPP